MDYAELDALERALLQAEVDKHAAALRLAQDALKNFVPWRPDARAVVFSPQAELCLASGDVTRDSLKFNRALLVAQRIAAAASERNVPVSVKYHDTMMVAQPGEDPAVVRERWNLAWGRDQTGRL